MTLNISEILRLEGLIKDFEVLSDQKKPSILISLKYVGKKQDPIITKLQRVSKPGVRVYVRSKNLPKILGNLGIAIISTSRGVMTNEQARVLKLGGEVLCYVW